MTNLSRKRWVLLRHIGAPDDLAGIHFDLLLEDVDGCRTWRLPSIPVVDGKKVEVRSSPVHSLDWLNRIEGKVSGDRGWVIRLEDGTYSGHLPIDQHDLVDLDLDSKSISGRLEIKDGLCRIYSLSSELLVDSSS